jgi:hypothetical protein
VDCCIGQRRRHQGDSRDEITPASSCPTSAELGLRRVSLPARGHHPGLKGAFTPIRGMTSGFRLGSFGRGLEFEEEEHYPGMGHGARYGPTMLTKQVSGRSDGVDTHRDHRARASRANSKKDLVTGPIRVFVPHRPDNAHETGVSAGGRSGSPIVAAEAEKLERTRRKTSSRA